MAEGKKPDGKKAQNKKNLVSRRQFLVGGGAVIAAGALAACTPKTITNTLTETTTKTTTLPASTVVNTVTQTTTLPGTTATATATTTLPASTITATTTTTAPPTTVTVTPTVPVQLKQFIPKVPPLIAGDGSVAYAGYNASDPFTKDPTKLITQQCFGNEWVNTIPDDPVIISPFKHHGYISGSPVQLTPYDGPKGTYDYFTQLAKSCPTRCKMWNIGKTSSGKRDMFVIAISSEDTIAKLDQYQANLNKLADPRTLGYPGDEAGADAAAAKLIADASQVKPAFWIWAALHSTECGSREMCMELMYRLAADKRPIFDEIRNNTIMMYTDPNPDGTEYVSEWVNFYMKDPAWSSKEPGPPWYNDYMQHDNNRDFASLAGQENKNLVKQFKSFPSQATLDLHQSMFLLYIFGGAPPTNPCFDPISLTEWQKYATVEMNQLQQFGMPGVWWFNYVTAWHPAGSTQMSTLRNGVGKYYETFGTSYPTTHTNNVTTLAYPPPFGNGNQGANWNWESPKPYQPRKIIWSYRDNNSYNQSAAIASALYIARNKEETLTNFWVKSKNAIANAGRISLTDVGDYTYAQAFVVPSVQKNMSDVSRMINNLLDNGCEVRTANAAFTIKTTTYPGGINGQGTVETKTYPAGSFILNIQQPYSRIIQTLMQPMGYGTGELPSDASAWQYPMLRMVEVGRIDDPAINNVASTLITGAQIVPVSTVGSEIATGYYAIAHNGTSYVITLACALAKAGFTYYFAKTSDTNINKGDVLVPANQVGLYAVLSAQVKALGLTMKSVASTSVTMKKVNTPRIALYHCWNSVQEGGWTRWVWDNYKVTYTVIQREDVLAGNLKSKYDVIFLPDESASQLLAGTSASSYPEEVWLGPIQTKTRNGGLGVAGIAEMKKFVDAGGLLICNNASTDFPITNNFISGVTRSTTGITAPACIVRILPDATSPVNYGAGAELYVIDDSSPVFTVTDATVKVVASFPADPTKIFMSGLLVGSEVMAGKPMIVVANSKDAPAAGGHVLLFGTDIIYRGQGYGSYFMMWNAMLNWDDLG